MTKLKSLFAKITASILGFFGIISFMACTNEDKIVALYGMPPNYKSVYGTVTGDIDGDGEAEPVQRIKVTFRSQDSTMGESNDPEAEDDITNEDGIFHVSTINPSKEYTIKFMDIDGEENGSFKDKETTLTFDEAANQEIEIKLERK